VSTLGIDSSAEMLRKAPQGMRGLSFEEMSIERFLDDGTATNDLIFSNAALHWIEGHDTLFERLSRRLAPGGEIAIQMPANFDHVSHRVAHELAASPHFSTVLRGYLRKPPVLPPERYADLLDRAGFTEQSVRLQIYPHRLDSRAGVVEWVKGTLLTDYASRMSADDYSRFIAEYTRILFERTEDVRPYFYPFKRILLRAVRK
ncbi:MAG: methyltransferase domain-containing protein, partial [Polyangiaceae bacterium]